MTSFINAYEKWVGPIPDIIKIGKAGRKSFHISELDEIYKYWSVEIQLLQELATELRKRVYNAGLRITQWHGPGALSSYAMNDHKIGQHMTVCNDDIREAARYAYAGGRFELFKLGRIQGPVWSLDINSAYPEAISLLPSLSDGRWNHVVNPSRIAKFGIYRIRIRKFGGLVHAPGPVFHRDREHNITFPWHSDGWYYSPEARIVQQVGGEILEGWEYLDSKIKPFSWVPEMYQIRKDWQTRGISAERALKLCLNAMYGKLAQRIGWDEETKRIPRWHQLEWAGWVTSFTRAKLYNLIMKIPWENLIGVETDGIYCTIPPEEIGITNSTELGGWGISKYDELLYIQSGLAWLRQGEHWSDKRRGLDPCSAEPRHSPRDCDCEGTFNLQSCEELLKGLRANTVWDPYIGNTSRFVGLGSALASRDPIHRHRVWETREREIRPGRTGKRIHIPTYCQACQKGKTAYETAHDLVIQTKAVIDSRSYPHDIPWENPTEIAAWRDDAELENGDVTLQYV
jgi:DNA polymerase type B, organellar and viral